MATLRELVAINLGKQLQQKGISQTELAKLLKVSFQTVNSYMNGRSGISSDMLAKMANVLEIEETDLVAVHKSPEKVEIPKAQLDFLLSFFEQQRLESVKQQEIVSFPKDIQEQIKTLKSYEIQWLFDLIRGAILLDNESKHSILYQVRVLSSASDQKNKAIK